MLPKVTIIVPVYNQEKYIRECVDSILMQDYENLEIIVVDDGSTDSTPDILKSYGSAIRYIRQANQGAAAALNHGLRLAQGELVAWLSSDDAYMPKKILKQVAKFQEDPTLDLIYTNWIMIDGEGNKIRTVQVPYPPQERFILEMLKYNFINGSSILMRKARCVEANYFDQTLIADVDGDMWFRLLHNRCKFGHVAEPLLKYRWHTNNLSHNFPVMQNSKDSVRVRVLQTLSYSEIFGEPNGNVTDKRRNYESLAWAFAVDGSVAAAHCALQQAVQIGKLSITGNSLQTLLAVDDPRLIRKLLTLPRFLLACKVNRENPISHLINRLMRR